MFQRVIRAGSLYDEEKTTGVLKNIAYAENIFSIIVERVELSINGGFVSEAVTTD